MNRLKKIVFYTLFFILSLLVYQDHVYAADKWPGVSASSLPGEYANMEYCIYNTSEVLTSSSDFSGSTNVYSFKSYIFIHDYTSKKIKFLGSNGSVVETQSKYKWDKNFINHYIIFGTDLYEYLVDEDGTLNCNKLYFIDQSGDLGIYSPDSFLVDFYGYAPDGNIELNDLQKNALNNINSYSATGIHYGENIVLTCNNNKTQIDMIMEKYRSGQVNNLKKLWDMTQTGFYVGKLVEAENFYNDYLELVGEIYDDLSSMDLNNIDKCSNGLKGEYDKLIQFLDLGIDQANEYKRLIDLQLTVVDQNGINPEYENDRESSDRIEEITQELEKRKEEWKNYEGSISFGTPIINATCEGILGPDLLDDISLVLTWIRIAVPIIVILLGSMDFAKAVLSDEQQELKKATSRFVKRCIIAVAIFFVPSIIMYLISFIDKIADVSCDIRLW